MLMSSKLPSNPLILIDFSLHALVALSIVSGQVAVLVLSEFKMTGLEDMEFDIPGEFRILILIFSMKEKTKKKEEDFALSLKEISPIFSRSCLCLPFKVLKIFFTVDVFINDDVSLPKFSFFTRREISYLRAAM